MNRDMYFLPIIERALRQPDARSALRAAFREIEEIGRQPPYRRGLGQFHQFMSAVVSRFDVTFNVTCDSRTIGAITANPFLGVAVMRGLTPGDYIVKLSTGRIVWGGTLTAKDVLWVRAFPSQELKVAADSGGARRQYSRREMLLAGEIELFIYPGVESGDLGIEIY